MRSLRFLWYWTTDQYIVQRALGAPNEPEARRGSIAAAFFKLLPVFIFIIPGMIAFAPAQSGKIEAIQAELFSDNAQNLSSGVYFYRIEVGDPARRTGEFQDVKKMILLR